MAQAVREPHAEAVSAPLFERQDEREFLRLRRASSVAYTRGARARQLRLGIILFLAAAGPLLTWVVSEAGAPVAAVTGLWLLSDRLALAPCAASQREGRPVLQEQHD